MLPAPPAPSEGSAGVRNLGSLGRSPLIPFSILAHQLRRRFRNGGPVRRPIRASFRGPSWGNTSSRPALPAASPREGFGAASRKETDASSGALFPADPADRPKALDIAGRRRSDFPPLPPRRVSPRWRLGHPSRSPLEHDSFVRVAKAESHTFGLWITGIWRISAEHIGDDAALPIAARFTTSTRCPIPLSFLPNFRSSTA